MKMTLEDLSATLKWLLNHPDLLVALLVFAVLATVALLVAGTRALMRWHARRLFRRDFDDMLASEVKARRMTELQAQCLHDLLPADQYGWRDLHDARERDALVREAVDRLRPRPERLFLSLAA